MKEIRQDMFWCRECYKTQTVRYEVDTRLRRQVISLYCKDCGGLLKYENYEL